MALLTDGCATRQRFAARVKLRSSHATRKYLIACMSMEFCRGHVCMSMSSPT
jgi:hypothetical protein